nr:GH32 C-terminal domain-containing protein [uncultured Carboxylicivirga sp.]
MTFYYEILVDRTSVEVFADHGKFSIISPLEKSKSNQGLEFKNYWGQIEIEELNVSELNSIWE